MKLRLRKSQVIELIHKNAPDYLELFNDFHTYDGGWLVWPEYLIKIKYNLKLDNYVTLYDDEKRINACMALFLFDIEELKKQKEDEQGLSDEQKQVKLDRLLDEVKEFADEFPPQIIKDFPHTPDQEKIAREEFAKLNFEDQSYLTQKYQYLFLGMLATFHNYFSVMVLGEKMTSLVPKAVLGDDESYFKAVKVDRNLITNHPYFKLRYETAQQLGDKTFLEKLAPRLSKPNLLGKIRYPGLYFIFSMLDAMNWLDEFTHDEILSLCIEAGLDRWQNRIDDTNAVTKQLIRFRRYQKSGGYSMH